MIKTEDGKLIQVTASGKRFELSSGKSVNTPLPTIGTAPQETSFYEPSYFRFLSAMASPTEGNIHLRLHNKKNAEPIMELRFHISAIGAAIMNCRYPEKIEKVFCAFIEDGTIAEIATDGGLGNRNFVRQNKHQKIRFR